MSGRRAFKRVLVGNVVFGIVNSNKNKRGTVLSIEGQRCKIQWDNGVIENVLKDTIDLELRPPVEDAAEISKASAVAKVSTAIAPVAVADIPAAKAKPKKVKTPAELEAEAQKKNKEESRRIDSHVFFCGC